MLTLSDQGVKLLKEVMAKSDTIRYRVFDVIIDSILISDQAFEFASAAGFLPKILEVCRLIRKSFKKIGQIQSQQKHFELTDQRRFSFQCKNTMFDFNIVQSSLILFNLKQRTLSQDLESSDVLLQLTALENVSRLSDSPTAYTQLRNLGIFKGVGAWLGSADSAQSSNASYTGELLMS